MLLHHPVKYVELEGLTEANGSFSVTPSIGKCTVVLSIKRISSKAYNTRLHTVTKSTEVFKYISNIYQTE